MFYLAVGIFFVAYALIISERIHRTTVALVGGVLMVLLGVLHQSDAFASIDFNTIGLLMGMMIIVSITRQTGLFQYVAIQAAKLAKGKPLVIMVYLSLLTAMFSAILDNVTTIMLVIPVTFVIADNLKVNPVPFIISEIILANLGGASSLIGDPVNILVGSAADLSFMDFLSNLGPIVLILIPVVIFILKTYFRKQLKTTDELRERIMKFNAKSSIRDKKLLIECLVVIAITILGFMLHGLLHLNGATVALFGAALLLIITDIHPEEILKELEWTTIIFFGGLFVMVAGVEEVGFIDLLANKLIELTQGSQLYTTMAILWGSALFSGILDNLPFVATMIPLVEEVGASGVPIDPLWWSLALGAVLGGNSTLIGASTNLVGAGLAERAGYKITFMGFMKIGFFVMLITMAISTIYILLRYNLI